MQNLVNIDIYLRFFVALGIIIILILVAAWLAKFFGFTTTLSLKGQKQRRLSVVDAIALDAKRRLLLVSRDGVEHLICVGGSDDFVIEQNVKPSLSHVSPDIIPSTDKAA